MKVIRTIADLRNFLQKEKQNNKSIGFVPTMGALHAGHISLVNACTKENEICVVSIFINPTQFNDPHDLETYPRTLDKDLALLEPSGCDYVFVPHVEAMYPEPDTRIFSFGHIAEVMEGVHRPGHFNGVAQIVSKLFAIVAPDNAYFGEKDFQQIAIIRAMVRQLEMNVKIHACPILRETDGLAMSSRNLRLSNGQRQKAPLIARTLIESTTFVFSKSVREIIDYVVTTINEDPVMQVEYYEIVDGNSLASVQRWSESDYIVGCIAVYCGKVRLIDNITYKG